MDWRIAFALLAVTPMVAIWAPAAAAQDPPAEERDCLEVIELAGTRPVVIEPGMIAVLLLPVGSVSGFSTYLACFYERCG